MTDNTKHAFPARGGLVALVYLCVWQTSCFAQAQSAPASTQPGPAVFEVRRFVVEGATLITAERIDTALTRVYRGGPDDRRLARGAHCAGIDLCPTRLSLDNTGTSQTGDTRIGAGFQYANLFNRDHVLNVQYITSPTQEDSSGSAGRIRCAGSSSNPDSGRANFSLVWVF